VKTLLLVVCFAALAACATTGQKSRSMSGLIASGQMPGSAESPSAAIRAVASATAMVGQPYRWGGAQPGGFDCSGLVVYAMGTAGVQLPRTAEQQRHSGVAVGRDELRAGDLIFMTLKHKELHVAIAIDGDKFVHAPSTGRYVRIDSLTVGPYARGFLEARRVINEGNPRGP
jgi:murein DD-endopeptidase